MFSISILIAHAFNVKSFIQIAFTSVLFNVRMCCAVLCAGERRFFDASGCVAFLFGIKHKLGCCVFVCESSHPHYSTEIEKAQSGALNLICIDVLMCHGRMSYHIRFITCSQTRTHTFLFVTYFHFLFVGSGAPALIYVFMYKLIAKHQSNFV